MILVAAVAVSLSATSAETSGHENGPLCWIRGASYGRASYASSSLRQNSVLTQYAPLVGAACGGQCYKTVSQWSSVAVRYGDKAVESQQECDKLCQSTVGCQVWTYWPNGIGKHADDEEGNGKGGCELFSAALDNDEVLKFGVGDGVVTAPKNYCNNAEEKGVEPWLPFMDLEEPDKSVETRCSNNWCTDAKDRDCCANPFPDEHWNEPMTCSTGSPVRIWGCHYTCCISDDQEDEDSSEPSDEASSENWSSPVNLKERSAMDLLSSPRTASDGRSCWLHGYSYGVGKDGACGNADIVAVHASRRTLDVGTSQGWWPSTAKLRKIPPSTTFSPLDCQKACDSNHFCGGWQLNRGACILREHLDCSPTISKVKSLWANSSSPVSSHIPSSVIAGVKDCVDVQPPDGIENAALDVSDNWFTDCDLPRCTAPHTKGTYVGHTFVPDSDDGEACWYKHFSPEELYEDCAQDRWIIVSGGSNSLSTFAQIVNTFAPVGLKDGLPLMGFVELLEYSVIDIVISRDAMPVVVDGDGDENNNARDGIIHLNLKKFCDIDSSLECHHSLSFQGGSPIWTESYFTALKSAFEEAPYEAGATRLTLVVGQYWQNSKQAMRALASNSNSGGWGNAKVTFYGQSMLWYTCSMPGMWCDFPMLGTTPPEVLDFFEDEFEDFLSTADATCSSERVDCLLATNGYHTIDDLGRKLVATMEQVAAKYEWANVIDVNGLAVPDEIIHGHMTPFLQNTILQIVWNVVCKNTQSHGCPDAIEASPPCWSDCENRGGGKACMCPGHGFNEMWECTNERQCTFTKLDPVPWEIAMEAPDYRAHNPQLTPSPLKVSSCFDADAIFTVKWNEVGSNKLEECNRLWCSTEVVGWFLAFLAFALGAEVLGFRSYLSKTFLEVRDHKFCRRHPNEQARNEEKEMLNKGNELDVQDSTDHASTSRTFSEPVSPPRLIGGKSHSVSPVSVIASLGPVAYKYKRPDSPSLLQFALKRTDHELRIAEEGKPLVVDESYENTEASVPTQSITKGHIPLAGERLNSLGFARLIASLHIVLGHLYAKGAVANVYFFGFGYTWVPFFFVLSGYVLTHARLHSSDPSRVDGPFSHVAKRLSTIFPMYAVGVLLAAIIQICKGGNLPNIEVLLVQSFMLQSWLPSLTEHALQAHCWFLSSMIFYWLGFGWVYKRIRNLSLRMTCFVCFLCCLLPWMTIIVPALDNSLSETWYTDHRWGKTESAVDILTVMLKFHPFFYIHVFVFGMLLAVFRCHLKRLHAMSEDRGLPVGAAVSVLTYFARFGATLGYAGLILLFTDQSLLPPAYKISERLSILLPLQGLVLLGLSPLPHVVANNGIRDPLAVLFALVPSWIGDVSYCQYVLQFNMYSLFPLEKITDPSFFIFLLGGSALGFKLVQEPGARAWKFVSKTWAKRSTVILLVLPASALATLLLMAKAINGLPTARVKKATSNFTMAPPYVRIAPEAVDLKLNWTTTVNSTLEDDEPVLINPSFLFRQDDNGGTEWVRSVRSHSVQEILTQHTFNTEKILSFESSILVRSEAFLGNLSAGFDDHDVLKWGLDGNAVMQPVNSNLVSHLGKKALWTDLCEPKASYDSGAKVLLRKQVSGPEDPKLIELPRQFAGNSTWGISFSSLPPASLRSAKSDQQQCRGTEKAVTQMYLASDGPGLASGQKVPGVRLKCGDPKATEKNWIGFTHEGHLYYIYSVEPHVVVHARTADGACVQHYESSSKELAAIKKRGVAVRGSATAVRYSEREFLALLHTHGSSGYSTLAYTFEASPPFRVLRVSTPLPLRGEGRAFASSLATVSDKVLIGYGVADRESRVLVMSRAYLESRFNAWCGNGQD